MLDCSRTTYSRRATPSALEQDLLDAVGQSAFNPFDGYLTKPELAKAMGRRERTLDNWHRYHIGPPRTKFGGLILYNIEAFNNGLQRNRCSTASA